MGDNHRFYYPKSSLLSNLCASFCTYNVFVATFQNMICKRFAAVYMSISEYYWNEKHCKETNYYIVKQQASKKLIFISLFLMM